MIAGLVEPDGGSVRLGETVKLGLPISPARWTDPDVNRFETITAARITSLVT
jgi:hypothetical protein